MIGASIGTALSLWHVWAGLLFGALAVILAIPAASAAETLIDVLVFGHEPPSTPPPRKLRPSRPGSPN